MSGWTMCRMMVLCTVSFVGLCLWTGCSKEYIACYGPFHVTSDTTVWFEGVTRGRVDHQFNRLMERHPDIRTVVFSEHCPGSNDDVSLYAAARVLRENGIRTVLLENSVVESGAVDLFISGAVREVAPGARIGVHSWSFGGGEDGVDLPPDHPEHDLYLDFYHDMFEDDALGEEFYWFTLNAASGDGIHYMTPEEIEYFDLATD